MHSDLQARPRFNGQWTPQGACNPGTNDHTHHNGLKLCVQSRQPASPWGRRGSFGLRGVKLPHEKGKKTLFCLVDYNNNSNSIDIQFPSQTMVRREETAIEFTQ